MKTKLLKTSTLLLILIFVLGTASTSPAAEPAFEKESKSYTRLKTTVDNAGPHDWETLTICAKKLIKKRINMAEAYEWLQKSLAINKNTVNLAAMGDYYRANNLPHTAINYYVESMLLGRSKNTKYEDPETLAKVIEQRKILYNYN